MPKEKVQDLTVRGTAEKRCVSEYKQFITKIYPNNNPAKRGILFFWEHGNIAAYDDIGRELEISGIKGLNLSKITKEDAEKMLRHLYIIKEPSDDNLFVELLVRGLGGWGEEHKGFEVVNRFNLLNPSTYVGPFQLQGSEGTYRWARQMEFEPAYAAVIAQACMDVDYDNTSPLRIGDLVAQGHHFSVYECVHGKPIAGGTFGDSRLIHAAEYLVHAVYQWNEVNKFQPMKEVLQLPQDSLNFLGKGLHSLQDIFSHADDFVATYEYKGIKFYHHLSERGRNADNLYYPQRDGCFNQRFFDTRCISYNYMVLFRKIVGLDSDTTRVALNCLSESGCMPLYGFWNTIKAFNEGMTWGRIQPGYFSRELKQISEYMPEEIELSLNFPPFTHAKIPRERPTQKFRDLIDYSAIEQLDLSTKTMSDFVDYGEEVTRVRDNINMRTPIEELSM